MAKTSAAKKKPRTATKRPHKKRGRKGENTALAFKDIPKISKSASAKYLGAEPSKRMVPIKSTDFVDFSKKHKISHKVLIQIKRHDPYKNSGKVFIRKDPGDGKLKIWRDPEEESTY